MPLTSSPDYSGGASDNGRHPRPGPIITMSVIRAELDRQAGLKRARDRRYRQRKKAAERQGQLPLFGFARSDDANTSTNGPLTTRKS